MPDPTPAARVHKDILALLRAPASVDAPDLSLAAAALPPEQRNELIERLAARREAIDGEIVRVPGEEVFGGRRSLEDWRAEVARIAALQRILGASTVIAQPPAVEQLDQVVCGCIAKWDPEVGGLVRRWLPQDVQPLWDSHTKPPERRFAIAFWNFPYRKEEAARAFLAALADLRCDASLARVSRVLDSTPGIPKPYLADPPPPAVKAPHIAPSWLGLLKIAWTWMTTDRFQLPDLGHGKLSMIKPLEKRRRSPG